MNFISKYSTETWSIPMSLLPRSSSPENIITEKKHLLTYKCLINVDSQGKYVIINTDVLDQNLWHQNFKLFSFWNSTQPWNITLKSINELSPSLKKYRYSKIWKTSWIYMCKKMSEKTISSKKLISHSNIRLTLGIPINKKLSIIIRK